MSKVILHIPHSSLNIPQYLRNDILLSDSEIREELEVLTDLYTDLIFQGKDTIKSDFSRFVCDVERFEDDSSETMSKLGMGAVYLKTPTGKKLRHSDEEKREHIMNTYYRPHHTKFEAMVQDKLAKYDECIILDCHSFNENITYVEMNDVDICIGSDDYHTPTAITNKVTVIFKSFGYTVSINNPFSGSIVPLSYYNKDKRVKSIMLEVNKRVYTTNGIDICEEGIERLTAACNQVIDLLDIN
ncbi:N-formylglutamate amidohydrolase [Clostridium algidicarnis]|uniref:N-formylglutamate amidohydrolase n=1 Tax=Clostridium algidicarnis TaxID=37659 RepID=UPI003FD8AC37